MAEYNRLLAEQYQNMNVGMVTMDLYRCFLTNSRICVLGSNHRLKYVIQISYFITLALVGGWMDKQFHNNAYTSIQRIVLLINNLVDVSYPTFLLLFLSMISFVAVQNGCTFRSGCIVSKFA